MSVIAVLPEHLISQIAAGEVVERPASVVKELIENAMDAGATRIEVEAADGGRYMRVADNGCGISPQQLPLAFSNHATSKLKPSEHVEGLQLALVSTMGFRGEALASIASSAHVVCESRTADAAQGVSYTVSSGQQVPVGCAVGTSLTVKNLFEPTPARLKFLKKPQTELGYIHEWVQQLAISHPAIQFGLRLNDTEKLRTTGSGNLKQTLQEVYGSQSFRAEQDWLPVEAHDAELGLSLTGFVSRPELTRSSRQWMLSYVNHRTIRCPVLNKAVDMAYESLLPGGRYPFTALFLTLPTTQVDINVHPAKREVRYAQPTTVFSFVRTAVRTALEQAGAARIVSGYVGATYSSGGGYSHQLQQVSVPSRPAFVSRPEGHHDAVEDTSLQAVFAYQPSRAEIQPEVQHVMPAVQSVLPLESPKTRVIGQLMNTFILVETQQGLMVVDQHIASERYYFEQFSLALQREAPLTQHKLTGEFVALSVEQYERLQAILPNLEQMGFVLAVSAQLAEYHVWVRGVPVVLQQCAPTELLLALLQTGEAEPVGHTAPATSHMLATLACHAAVRAGDVLRLDEMQAIVAQWLSCTLPWTCPHGRPIAHTIESKALMAFFDRPSLPV